MSKEPEVVKGSQCANPDVISEHHVPIKIKLKVENEKKFYIYYLLAV